MRPASASLDSVDPTSAILAPKDGERLFIGDRYEISGTAEDFGGGVVGAVEVSTDGGETWQPAIGGRRWKVSWVPENAGEFHVLSRAVDDSGNIEKPPTGTRVLVNASESP